MVRMRAPLAILEPRSPLEKLDLKTEGVETTRAKSEDLGRKDVGHPILRKPMVDSDNGLQQLCLLANRLDETAPVASASIDTRGI